MIRFGLLKSILLLSSPLVHNIYRSKNIKNEGKTTSTECIGMLC